MNTPLSELLPRNSALLAGLALLTLSSTSWGQSLSTAGGNRSVNERIATETPPPINTDPSRPELRSAPATAALQALDKAILIEHAVDMAIEGSGLQAIAGPANPASADVDILKNLRNKARKMMGESQALLGQAAADTQGLAASPVVGRFHAAANLYVTTLAAMESPNPAEAAQVAMINQAVKDVLDADHIQQMSQMNTLSVALQQLKAHATQMKTEGSDLIRRMCNEGTADPSISVNVATLASRGRQLLAVADELGRLALVSSNQVQSGANPGRFLNTTPEVIGGTYGASSPRVGVYQLDRPIGSNAPKALSEPSTIPTYSGQTTGSTAGVKPQ